MAVLFGPRKMPVASPVQQLRLQTSTMGRPVPICYGKTRVSGNMIWYGDFKATAHEHSTGKGGGISQTDYTYNVSFLMGICEGQINQITKVWRQKEIFSGTALLGQQEVSGTQQFTLPTTAPYTVVVDNASTYTGVNAVYYVPSYLVGDNDPNNRQVLQPGSDYTVNGGGSFTFNASFAGEVVKIDYRYNSGGWIADACGQVGLGVGVGYLQQAPIGWIVTRHAAEDADIHYNRLAYVNADNYDLGNVPDFRNHTFEVDTKFGFSPSIRDAHPQNIIIDLLCNPDYGAGFPADRFGYWDSFYRYCIAANIFLSPAYIEQKPVREMIEGIMKITNCGIYQSEGMLKVTPFQDTSISANGVSWDPNLTPVYDLTDDDFEYEGGEDPVKMTRKSSADAYNHVRIKFYDRDQDYNESIMEAKDQANIEQVGLRSMDILDCPEICLRSTAQWVVQSILQRVLYIRNTYEFKLSLKYCLLEPTDLVTITDENLGLIKMPCRITNIEEDEEGNLNITAEEFPLNVTTPAKYNTQAPFGYQVNFNAAPGNAANPVIFEPPIEIVDSNTGLDVWVAVGSNAANYGGCEVWVSTDNSTYRKVGRIDGSSRYGFTKSAIAGWPSSGFKSGEYLDVQLVGGGQLLSGNSTDASIGTTLCYVGGEMIAYTTAGLIATDTYRLNGINRGFYSSGQPSHGVNEDFVRVDDQLVKIPLDPSFIGKTIYIKCTSFNIYGAGDQSIADVSAHAYTVTGRFVKLPPPDVSALTVQVKPDGTRNYSWVSIAPIDVVYGGGYQIRYRAAGSGIGWASMTKLHEGLLTASPYETSAPVAGKYDFAIVMVDKLGNISNNALFILNATLGNEPVSYGASSNLLLNSDWLISTGVDSSTDGSSLYKWLTYSTITAHTTTYHRHYPSNPALVASQGCCTVDSGWTTDTTQMSQVYQFVNVLPNVEYETSVYVGVDKSVTRMQIEWMDVNNNLISVTNQDTYNPSVDGATDPKSYATMKRLWAKGTAPSNAKRAVFNIKKFANADGSWSGGTFSRAFMGVARSGVTRETATPWIESGIDNFHGGGIAPLTVGTSQLTNGAATDIISVTGTATLPLDSSAYNIVTQATFTPLASGKLTIIATGDTSYTDSNPAANPVYVFEARSHFDYNMNGGAYTSTPDLTFSTLTSIVSAWRGQYSVSYTIDAQAGVAYNVRFMAKAQSSRYQMNLNSVLRLELVKK